METLELIRDFVNTYNVESSAEGLDSPAALVRWLAGRGLAGPRVRATAADVDDAIAVREALRTLLLENNHIPVETGSAAETLDRAGRRAGLAVRFAPDGRWQAEPGSGGVAGALGRILGAAAEAMASTEWVRLKACRAETCHWAFIDQARNRSRSWCSMGVCGNRQKARRYRERRAGVR
jgi:predicted RNA-binding Zn ribbon-like protein